MSLLIQKSTFSEGCRSLELESHPCMISALEKIAIALGATVDDVYPHHFYFNLKNCKHNLQSLDVIEMVWKNLPEIDIHKICINYNNECLIIERDDEICKVFLALIKVLGKDINCGDIIVFSDNEKNTFRTICDIANKLEIFPA